MLAPPPPVGSRSRSETTSGKLMTPPSTKGMQHASAACVPCAQKKRKCDRLLPVCSRCSSIRTNEPCWYKNSPQPHGPAGRPVIPRQPSTAEKACKQCRSKKRACNRALPSCLRCQLQSTTCVYDPISPHTRSANSPSQVSTEVSRAKVNPRVLYGPDIYATYPVRHSKDLPRLIHHFCSFVCVPAKAARPNSLATHVQSTWMRSALLDPCHLHSTLFAASAHIDGLLGIPNNPRTIYHQLQAVQLLRKRLTQPDFRVDYATIAAVLGLGFFDMVIGNTAGVQAHNHGLIQMLATKHGREPETTELMGLANLAHFALSMVSHKDALFLPNTTIPSEDHPLSGIFPTSIMIRILARVAAHTDTLAPPIFTADTVLDLIGTAREVTQQDAESTTAAGTSTILTLGAEALRQASFFPSPENESSKAPSINKCVQLAAKLCRKLLLLRAVQAESSSLPLSPSSHLTLSSSPSSLSSPASSSSSSSSSSPPTTSTITIRSRSTTTPMITTIPTPTTTTVTRPNLLHDDILLLKATLPKIDFVSWLQHAPEAYVWVCFTAAVAAYYGEMNCEGGNDDWTSFILTPMPVITATDSAELRVMREGWAYLRWLRGHS